MLWQWGRWNRAEGNAEIFLQFVGFMGPFPSLANPIRKSTLNTHWKDWCWSWSSSTLATWCEEPTRWKRPWCWERLKAEGEGDDRGWDDWMASLTHELKKTRVIVKDREAWCAAVRGIAKNWTQLSNWTMNYNTINDFEIKGIVSLPRTGWL